VDDRSSLVIRVAKDEPLADIQEKFQGCNFSCSVGISAKIVLLGFCSRSETLNILV